MTRFSGRRVTAVVVVIFLAVVALADGQTLAWEPTAGPYGGIVQELHEAPSGHLLAGTRTAAAFVSHDGGDTWNHASVGAGDRNVQAFASADGVLYAGTLGAGLYRSDDGGQTWARTGYGPATASSLASIGSRIFATSTELRGVLMSSDGGATWARSPGINARARGGRALAVVGDTLYMAGDGDKVDSGLWRTNDAGLTWSLVYEPRWPFRYLYSSGVDAYAVYPSSILRSTDGGVTWREMDVRWQGADLLSAAVVGDTLYFVGSHKLYRTNTEGNALVTRIGSALGTVFAMLPVGADLLAAGFGKGLWRTRDGGDHWGRLPLANTEIRGMAAGDGVVYAGSNGAEAFRSRNDGRRWVWIGAGAGAGRLRVIAASGQTVYAYGVRGLLRSDDEGNTWTTEQVTSEPNALLLEPDGAVLVGARGVHLSRDAGATWALAGVWDADVRDLARRAGGYVAAASDGVHLSNAGGGQWRPTGLSGTEIEHVFADKGILWAASSSEVLRSADTGETWARLPLGGPDMVIEHLTGANGYLYAATSHGVFASDDLGNSWRHAHDGLPDTRVTELLAHEGFLYAATNNLGVYRSAAPAAIATPTVTILSPAPEQTLGEDTTQTEVRVALRAGVSGWRWRIGAPFGSSGVAGGYPGPGAGVDLATGLSAGSHTLFVTLVDAAGNVLRPDAQDAVTFHVAADSDAPEPSQRVRHTYEMPQGLSMFSPVLDGDRIRTHDVSLDLPPGVGGLRASHLAAIGSTVVVDLGEGGSSTVIARGGRILYGSDFALSGERGYVVNFREPLTFTLEGAPYGTPIISDAVAAAPGAAPADAWAFVAGVRVMDAAMYPGSLRARVRNARTGQERAAGVGMDGTAVLPLVDMGRDPVVEVGDTLAIDVLAPDGRSLGRGSTTRVTSALLADAHAVALVSAAPARSVLLPNHPNPFNPETWLPFELAEAGDVTLTLYDGAGRRVRLISWPAPSF